MDRQTSGLQLLDATNILENGVQADTCPVLGTLWYIPPLQLMSSGCSWPQTNSGGELRTNIGASMPSILLLEDYPVC